MRFSNIISTLSIACSAVALGHLASRAHAQYLKATVRTLSDEEVQKLRDNGELKENELEDSRMLSSGQTLDEDFFEEIDFELKLACGAYEDIKDKLEKAFLRYYKDLFEDFKDCGVPEQNTTSFTLLFWENALKCDGYYRRALEGEGTNWRIDRELRKRRKSRGKGRRKGKCNGCKKRRRRMETEESFIIDLSEKLARDRAWNSLAPGRELGDCKADLEREIQESGLPGFEDATVEEEVERSAECDDKSSDDCVDDEFCCGSVDCRCDTPSVSLCESNGCCIRNADPFDPDFCRGVGSCSLDPCATDKPTPTPTEEPTASPTSSPTSYPSDSPSTEPSSSPSSNPSDSPSAAPSSSPSDSPSDDPTRSPTGFPTASPSTAPSSSPSSSPTKYYSGSGP